ncbi:MAG: sulfotransferase family 2 domain-containing protein [Alphaproteobacteria bacterium]|jgi:hypothetical protein|nr:sulfotransferase family 2 domain-containing protein [Alphaproteobacteria bacterium]
MKLETGPILGIPAEAWAAPPGYVLKRLTYASYVSQKYKYVFVETPKAACTTLKNLIHRLEDLPPIQIPSGLPQTKLDMYIHNRQKFLLPSLVDLDKDAAREALFSDEYFRFCVVRNPYSRLFSAWLDKVKLVEPGYARIVKEINQYYERPADTIVEFEDFVAFVCRNQDVNRCDHHWRLQIRLLFPHCINYTHIGRLESLATTFGLFLGHLRKHGFAGQLPERKRNQSPPVRWQDAFDRHLADQVFSRYAGDFAAFAYGRESWVGPGPSLAGEPGPDRDDVIRYYEREIRERNRVIQMLNQAFEKTSSSKRSS